jgi:hypothetical protein
MNTPNLVYVEKNCIVCTSSNHSKIYESIQPAGAYLGTLTVSLHSCHVCGFVWQNPQLSDEVLANYYASDINASGAVFHSHNIHSEHSLVRAELLLKPSIHAGFDAFCGVNKCKFLR